MALIAQHNAPSRADMLPGLGSTAVTRLRDSNGRNGSRARIRLFSQPLMARSVSVPINDVDTSVTRHAHRIGRAALPCEYADHRTISGDQEQRADGEGDHAPERESWKVPRELEDGCGGDAEDARRGKDEACERFEGEQDGKRGETQEVPQNAPTACSGGLETR